MSKSEAIQKAGNSANLAKILGVSRQAVCNWVEIPKGRIWQLKVLKPEWFASN